MSDDDRRKFFADCNITNPIMSHEDRHKFLLGTYPDLYTDQNGQIVYPINCPICLPTEQNYNRGITRLKISND